MLKPIARPKTPGSTAQGCALSMRAGVDVAGEVYGMQVCCVTPLSPEDFTWFHDHERLQWCLQSILSSIGQWISQVV